MLGMFPTRQLVRDAAHRRTASEVLHRIGVQPPYYSLFDVAQEGARFHASAVAESPPYLEVGPMPAAELGRHAAITGSCHAATLQQDDGRRYYLARGAECRYVPNVQPYGSEVRFTSDVAEMSKRACRVSVTATAGGKPLAAFEINYTILTEAAFQRLFRIRAQHTPAAPSPYGTLLQSALTQQGATVEQRIEALPVAACAGHFDGYPALPVAVLMGQLSYLAGRLFGDPPRPFRVVRGEVSATDLAWAGETSRFRAWRDGTDESPESEPLHRFECEALAGDRRVGHMRLWLTSVD